MAAAIVEFWAQNPPLSQQVAGGGVFTRIVLERSPTQGGAYVQAANVPIDNTDEDTYVVDQAGDDTYWYRVRYANDALAIFSAPNDPIQAGDTVIRQDLAAEIPDADVTQAMWNRWGRLVLIDLYAAGIWKPAEAQIVITSTGSRADELYAIPSQIRDVYAIEVRDNAGHVLDTLTDPEEWLPATNRHLRIFDAYTDTGTTYWVLGKSQYRALGELEDDFHVLAMHMCLVKYGQYRKRQREHWKKWITMDPTTDLSPQDLLAFIEEEKREVRDRVAALALPEPAIPIPS